MSGGYIAGSKGLAWIHWVNVILAAILLIACAILVPETMFNRELVSPTNPGSDDSTKTEKIPHTETLENVTTTSPHRPDQVTGLTSMLKVQKYQGNAFQKFSASWKTLRLPGVWLVMFWYAGLVGGVVTITTVGPTLIASPPYLWGNNAGLIMTVGVIGALLGFIATNLSADRVIIARSRLPGKSVIEPETRLLIAIPGLILATTGLWTFGFARRIRGRRICGWACSLGLQCFVSG
jgi:MFS family permease